VKRPSENAWGLLRIEAEYSVAPPEPATRQDKQLLHPTRRERGSEVLEAPSVQYLLQEGLGRLKVDRCAHLSAWFNLETVPERTYLPSVDESTD
jgi:hypothetical protein